jgi:archaeosortase A (PGF-CTERM-specific)
MVFFCFILSRHIFRENETAKWVTKATCITSIIYFPFAEIPILNENIIGGTALLTAWFIHLLGTPTLVSSPKIFLLIENPLIIGVPKIEIILACTAIESIALFSGVILSVGAEKRRKTLALLATVPTIYGLNLIRNIYVAHAFAYTWYGTPEYSFYLAHHIISKAGSAIALIALAWITFRILPEVLEKISDTVNLVLGRG